MKKPTIYLSLTAFLSLFVETIFARAGGGGGADGLHGRRDRQRREDLRRHLRGATIS